VPCSKKTVVQTPEEEVRQRFLKKMIEELEFPLALIGVEKEIKDLPHLVAESKQIRHCRFDIVVYGKGIHPHHSLFPLLLIECKGGSLNSQALTQLLGYNSVIGAPYVAAVGAEEELFGWLEEGIERFHPFVPKYSELISSLSHL